MQFPLLGAGIRRWTPPSRQIGANHDGFSQTEQSIGAPGLGYVFARHCAPCHQAAFAVLHHRDDADDAVGNVFSKLPADFGTRIPRFGARSTKAVERRRASACQLVGAMPEILALRELASSIVDGGGGSGVRAL